MNDPLSIWRTRIRLTMILGTIAMLGFAAWAFTPLIRTTSPSSQIVIASHPTLNHITDDKPPFSINAFSVKLWPNARPSQSPASIQPSPTNTIPLPHLQLISIIQEDHGLRAAVYDSNQNKLVIIQPGDQLPPFTVSAITETAVKLQRGNTTRVLPLREDSP